MKKSGEILELGKRCRRWVLDHVDINDGVKAYMAIYRDLITDRQVKQYINKSWYQQEQILQSGFKSDFYKYMVEEGVFGILRLKMEDYDKRLYN